MTDPSPLPDPAAAAYDRGKAEAYEALAVRVLMAAGISVAPGRDHRALALAAVEAVRGLKEERDDARHALDAAMGAGVDFPALAGDAPHPGPGPATALVAEIHGAMNALREAPSPPAPPGAPDVLGVLDRAAVHIIEERDRRAGEALRRPGRPDAP